MLVGADAAVNFTRAVTLNDLSLNNMLLYCRGGAGSTKSFCEGHVSRIDYYNIYSASCIKPRSWSSNSPYARLLFYPILDIYIYIYRVSNSLFKSPQSAFLLFFFTLVSRYKTKTLTTVTRVLPPSVHLHIQLLSNSFFALCHHCRM